MRYLQLGTCFSHLAIFRETCYTKVDCTESYFNLLDILKV
jgi:hypothetical protein